VVAADGVAAGVLLAVADVSEQEEQQLAGDRAHRRLEAMLANISDTVTMVDADGVVIDTTGLHASVMGYETDYWKQRSVMDLVDPDDLPRLLEAYELVMSAPGASVTLDLQVQQADADWADIELTAVNLLDDPSVGGIVITSRNITQRKQTEAELARRRDEALEQSRLRAEFVARVSHELRNQLHALQGLTELLSTTDVPRSVAQLVETVHRQSEQFEHLVDDLMEYSHIDADRFEPRAVPCWPRQLVADAVAVGRELAGAGVEVTGHADEAVADVVMLDERRVRQVLANLVSNAAKFTRDGRIEVHVEHADLDGDAGLRWRVSDTGRGIVESDLERVFWPFEQSQAGVAAGGVGLGLAITERIVVALGGRIGVESTVGEGSEFHVVLPAPVTDVLPAGPAQPMVRMRPRAHVLVVEDNAVNQMLVAEQLSRLGARATVVGSGPEALEVLRGDHDIQCVLMDWQLPGLDGVEVTRRHRDGEGPDRRLPIIGMTASGRPSDRATCLDAGMEDLLVKPVSLADLGNALRPWIGERRSVPRVVSAPPGADTAALDLLADQLGSVAPVRSIVGTFLQELEHRELAVAEAVDSGDADLLHRTAHTLRSMSGTLGANDLDALSRTLEQGAFPPESATLEAFADAVRSTRTALDAWLALHPAGTRSSGPISVV
jgi:PAS domain S-box-containing protein